MSAYALAHPYLAFLLACFFGVLGILCVPKMSFSYSRGYGKADLDRAQAANDRGLKEVADALERLSIITIYHDATCRGKSPETIGSTEELLRLLKGKNVSGGDKT